MKFDLEIAIDFLETIDWCATDFSFQTFDDSGKDRALTKLKHGRFRKLQKEFKELNKNGAGIYVTVNETNLKGRTADDIVAPRALFLDDDGEVTEPPIEPSIIVHTSEGKRHLYYLIDNYYWSLREYKKIQKQFVRQYGGDKNASDLARVMRVPGFYNMKDRENPYFITAEIINIKPKSKKDILAIIKSDSAPKNDSPIEKEYTEHDLETVKKALSYVCSDNRETWIKFGIALKNDFGDDGFEIWDEWSQESQKYNNGECEEKWRGFTGKGDIHIASIIYEAQQNGFNVSNTPDAPAPEDDFDHYDETPLALFKAADFEGKDIPKQRFVIEDLLISGASVSLYGDPGIGKSTLALQMCAAIALGENFIGFKTNIAKCLILSCEDDLDEIHRRLDRMCWTYNWNFEDFKDNLVFCCRAGNNNLFIDYVAQGRTANKTNFFKAFIQTIKSEGFDFVVIDNIANVFGGNENDRSETTRFMSAIYALCTTTGISVMLLGHPPKGSGNYSGSTAWEATVRQRFSLKKDKYIHTLKCEKANYIRVGEEIEMAKDSDGVFIETVKRDNEEEDFDFEGLKAKIWNFVKECNDNNISISFAHQAGTDYYAKQLRFNGMTKGYKLKDIHSAVKQLTKEGRLTKKPGTAKMIAVECV